MSASTTPNTLSDFLKTRKDEYLSAIDEGKSKDWTVVTGNEAGDLDSLASAVAFAWYLPKIVQTPAVPLLHTPRSDIHLRAENLYALELAGIETVEPPLLCIDDIPVTKPFPSNKFALVDHNRLHPHLAEQNPDATVVSIIDHHEDEGLYKDTADPRIIVIPCGSASSLVALYLQEKCGDHIPQNLATLLLCAVLVDTGGLKPGGKAVEADRAAAAFLLPRSLLAVGGASLNVTEPHDDPKVQEVTIALQAKKASVSHLSTSDLLRRDYKEYVFTPSWEQDKSIRVGLASVPVGLKPWIKRGPAFWESAEKFIAHHNLTVLGILTSFRDEDKLNKHGRPKHKREQLFVVRKGAVNDLERRLFEGLEANTELKLKPKNLSKVSAGKGFSGTVEARAWKQKNVDATRKTTAPAVKTIIEGTA